MAVQDEEIRDVLAGLSFYVGRGLRPALIGVAEANDLPVGGWVFPADTVPAAVDDRPDVDIVALGRLLRERGTAAGITMLIRGDAGWPAGTACDELPCLWVRGDSNVGHLLRRAVTITGSRTCTPWGRLVARDLAYGFAIAGWTVVTSGAGDVDRAATASVLGVPGGAAVLIYTGGLDYRWRPSADYAVDTAAQGGTVVSAFPPGRPPTDTNATVCNRLLGTFAAATVIVEADTGSPALLAARIAATSGRLACAVPGPVTSAFSAGCHQLIVEGTARLITDVDTVMAAIDTPRLDESCEALYQVTGTAQWDAGYWHSRPVPTLYVQATSHDDAARVVFDVVFAVPQPGATLTVGVYGSTGAYRAVEISATT